MSVVLNKDDILTVLGQQQPLLKQRFSVCRIGLFGSCVRSQAVSDSDIDLLVEFEEPTYDRYMDLKFFLETLFNAKVDLVLADNVKQRLKPYIMREVVYA